MKLNAILRAALLLALLLPTFHVHADVDGIETQSSCAVCLHVADDDCAVDQPLYAHTAPQQAQTDAFSVTYTCTTLIKQRARAPPKRTSLT